MNTPNKYRAAKESKLSALLKARKCSTFEQECEYLGILLGHEPPFCDPRTLPDITLDLVLKGFEGGIA